MAMVYSDAFPRFQDRLCNRLAPARPFGSAARRRWLRVGIDDVEMRVRERAREGERLVVQQKIRLGSHPRRRKELVCRFQLLLVETR